MKRKIKIIISVVLAFVLMFSNLSPISWLNNATQVQAADEVDFSTLDETTWSDFGVNTELQLRFDVTATRTDGAAEDLRVYFFNQAQESGVCDEPYIEALIPTNETTTVKMDLADFLVDGALPGFGFAIQNGPAWDSGVTITMQMSNVQIVGDFTKDIDMSNVTWTSGDNTGLTGGNNWGSISYADGVTTMTGMIMFSTHEVSFATPVTTEAEWKLRFDVVATRTDGAAEDLRVYFFNQAQESGVCDEPYIQAVISTNETTTVEMDLADFLVDGALPGFGFAIQNGPAWDSGVTITMQMSNVQIVGDFTKDIDMSNVTWTSGDNTGLTGGNNWGSISYADDVTSMSGMISFSTHEVTFAEPITTETEWKLCFDVVATRTDGAAENLRVYFFNQAQESGVCDNPYVEAIIPTNETTTVEMDLADFLVDGALPGFGFAIQNGPAWDSGVTITMQMSNVQIVGDFTKDIDMSNVTWTSGDNTGLTGGNNWGSISYADGVTTMTGMISFSTHEVLFATPVTTKAEVIETVLQLRFDVTATRTDGAAEDLRVYFFNQAQESGVCDNPYVEAIIPTNETTTVEMDLADFLVDGALPGFGFAIQNGPAWDSGVTITMQMSNVQIVGDFTKDIDMSNVTWTSGDNTGLTGGNNWGSISYADDVTTMSGMISFSTHEATFAEPITTEVEWKLRFDVAASRTDGAAEDLRVYFFNQAQESGVCDEPYIEAVISTNETTTVEMDLADFLVDGALPGFGFAIQNGPAWDSGVTITMQMSNVQIVGDFTKDIDMSNVAWTSGDSTGLTGGNNWGSISYADGVTTMTGMIMFSTHEVSFATPVTTEADTKLCFDLTASTIDGTTEEIKVRFFNHSYTGNIDGEPYVEKMIPADGTTTAVELLLDDLLVDGKFCGLGFGILNGPEWNSPTDDRTSLKFENVRIEGAIAQDIDLSTVTWTKGSETGITGSNNWGNSSYSDGATTISGMICYEAHEFTLAEPIRVIGTLFELQDSSTLDNTVFNGDIKFKEGGVFYYGAEHSGLSFALTEDGKMAIGARDYAFSDANIAIAYEASNFGLDTFEDTQFNMKIAMKDVASDGSSAKIAIWINNIMIGTGYFTLTAKNENGYPISNTMLFDTSKVLAYLPSIDEMPVTVEIPTDLTELTWEDFGITCIGQYTTISSGSLAGKELNNSLFSGDITMQADSHMRYGGGTGDYGLHIQVNSSGTLSLLSHTCTLGLDVTEFKPEMYGLTSFANNRFNLKIAVTELTNTSAKVGVWVNDKILGDYFTLTCNGDYTLGTCMALYSGNIEPHSTLSKPTGLTNIRLGDWNSSVYDDGLLYWDEISTAAHPTVDTLVGTSFNETVTFQGPTDSTDSNYVIYYGGAKDESDAVYGLRIAFIDDYIKLFGYGSYGLNTFILTKDVAGVDSFTDTEYVLQLDTVQRGNHVLFYMYFDGVLYGGAPFVLPDFADMMNDTFAVFPFPEVDGTQVQKPVILQPAERTLSDLYHDLDASTYTVPAGVISMQKKVIAGGETSWSDITVAGGETLNATGDYKITYSDGLSKYNQEVVLYRAGDAKIDVNNEVGAADLVRLVKHIKSDVTAAYKCEEKAYDVNGDYTVDSTADTMNNVEVTTLRQMILNTYVEDTSVVMPILGHFGPLDDMINDEIFSLIKGVGINQITQYQNYFTMNPSQRYDVYEQLSLAQKYGLKITVKDYRLAEDPATATKESVLNAIADYKDYQSFAGLYISDEPKTDTYPPNYNWGDNDENLADFAPLAQAVNGQGIFGYANAVGYSYNYVNNRTSQYQYVNYLREFVDEYQTSFLSHTYYPFWESHSDVGGTVEDSEDYFQNLAMTRYVASEKNIPFWTFVQSGDGFELTPVANNPSEGEFKWNANIGLAFGAKGLQYFPLVQPDNFQNLDGEVSSGLISSTGEPTRWYNYAIDVNKQVAAIDDVLMNSTNVGIMSTGTYANQAAGWVGSIPLYDSRWFGSAKETITTPIHSSYSGATVSCTDSSYGALTGCFEYGDKHALYIVNYNVTSDNSITVNFDSSVSATLIYDATTTEQTGTSMNITLGAGEAVLVVY